MANNKKENKDVLEESLLEYNEIINFIGKNSEMTVSSLLEDKVKNGLNNIINEAFGEDDEDETSEDEPVVVDGEEEGPEDITPEGGEGAEDEGGEEVGAGDEDDGPAVDFGADGMDAEGEPDADDEEDLDIDAFKTGEDEYDLTNSDTDTLVKIFKKIGNDDKVIVKKLGDGKIDLIDNENDTEYVIDLNGGSDVDFVNTEDEFAEEDENEFEEGESLNEDEDAEIEIELNGAEDNVDEKVMTQSIGANRRVGVMSQTRKENAPGKDTNRDGAKLIAKEDIKKAIDQKVKLIEAAYAKKFNELNEEVEQYKKTLGMFTKKMKEQAVLNNNLAKYAKLVTENATSKAEKVEILKKFSTEATTIEQGNKLFESLNNQLKKVDSGIINVDKQFSVSGEKKQVNESIIYQSDELEKVRSLMGRIK